MSIRTWLQALACTLAIGCGVGPKPTFAEASEPVDETKWASDEAHDRLRSSPPGKFRFISRPLLASWKSFVYEDLPLSTPGKPGSKLEFVVPDPRDRELRVTGDWVAVLEGNGGLAYTQRQSSSPLQIAEQLGSEKRRMVCLDRMRADTMRALSIGTFSDDSVHFARLQPVWTEGPKGRAGGVRESTAGGFCEGTANATLEARAIALLPGVLYAFRTCKSSCDVEADPARVEELTVIGPASYWTVGTVDPKRMTARQGGPFTVTSVELRRGASASLLLHVGWRELAYFIGLHGKPPYWAEPNSNATGQVLSLGVDVVWPDRGPAEALVYASEVTPDAVLLLNASAEPP